ncbi:serine-rich adhesin for platelets-like [Dermacentor albipictus]|uniref:serine-rich adhesin for platelets-like n=1 Tax=Dermacentor albipictus TaxID=60249 RepID=UPI0038FC793D
MESSSLIFRGGSRSHRSTFVTTLFVVALVVGAVAVTGFVLFAVFGGWNTGVTPGRRSTAPPLLGRGGNEADASSRSKGPYTPRWYSVLISNANSTSAEGNAPVTLIDTPVNDSSSPLDGAEGDVLQPVPPAVDEPRSTLSELTYPSRGSRPDSAETGVTPLAEPRQDEEEVSEVPPAGKSKEEADISETAMGDSPPSTESEDAGKLKQHDLISELNDVFVSREPGGSVQDDDDSRTRSRASLNETAEEDGSDESGEDEFAGETDAVETDLRDATSDSSLRTEGATEAESLAPTRVVSEQGTNYEPAHTDDEDQGRDEAATQDTAAISRGEGDDLQEEDLEYDTDATAPGTYPHTAPDDVYSPKEDQSKPETPITDGVSKRGPEYVSPDFHGGGQSRDEPADGDGGDVVVAERDEGVEEEPDLFITDGTITALPRVEGASEREPPHQSEYITEPGIAHLPAEIESGAPDRHEPTFHDEGNTGSVQVPTYKPDDVTQSVSQDVATYGTNQMTRSYVTPMDVSIYAQGGGEAQPYRNDADLKEESSSTATALEITYGTVGDADISSIIDEEDTELPNMSTQNNMFSDTPAIFTSKDSLQEAEFLNKGSGSLSQTPGTSEAGLYHPYEASEGNWDDGLLDSGSTVRVGDEDGIRDGTDGKIAPITRDKSNDGSEVQASGTRTTVQEDDFDKIAREAYSFIEDTSEAELPRSNPTTERNSDEAPARTLGIDLDDGTTYIRSEWDWSEIGSVVPEKRRELQMSVPANRARTRSSYAANRTVVRPLNLSPTAPVPVISKVRPRASRPKTRNATAPAKTSTPTRSNGHRTQRHSLGKYNGLVVTPWHPVNSQVAHRNASLEGPVGSMGSNASTATIGQGSSGYETTGHVTISWASPDDGRRPRSYRSEATFLTKQSTRVTLEGSSSSPQELTPRAKSIPVIITSRTNGTATLQRHSRTTAIAHSEANEMLRKKERSTALNMPRRDYDNRVSPLVKQQPVIVITIDPQKANSSEHRDVSVPTSSTMVRRNVTKREAIRRERFATAPLTRKSENYFPTTSFLTRSRSYVADTSARRHFSVGTPSLSLQDTTASTAHNFAVMTKRNNNAHDNFVEKRGGGLSS